MQNELSFLTGASHAEELALRAKELGYHALAITDESSLAGVVRAHIAAKESGLKLLLGAELHPVDAPAVVVWATDRSAYGRLSRLLTVGRRRAEKGKCNLTFADIAEHAQGLIAGVLPVQTADPRAMIPYRDLFSEGTYLLAELFRGPDDAARLAELVTISRKTRLPLVAAGDVHYHCRSRQPLHETLTAIRLGKTVADIGGSRFPMRSGICDPFRKPPRLSQRHQALWLARSRLQIAARSRSMSCVTSIPKSWRPRASPPPATWLTWPGKAPAATTLPASRKKSTT